MARNIALANTWFTCLNITNNRNDTYYKLIQKHIHKVNSYPRADNFTQALLVILVTDITSVPVVWQVTDEWKDTGNNALQWGQQISHMWPGGISLGQERLRRQSRPERLALRCLSSSSFFSPLPWLCQHLFNWRKETSKPPVWEHQVRLWFREYPQ